MDIYVFATPYRVTWDYYFLSREHTIEFDEWAGKAEYDYVSLQIHLLLVIYGAWIGVDDICLFLKGKT